jgi:hypothetical protein
LDGNVATSDLSILLANYDRSGMNWYTGDFNHDGIVDIYDFHDLLMNYGAVSMASAPAITAVPEPSAAVLFGIAAIGLAAYLRRRPA